MKKNLHLRTLTLAALSVCVHAWAGDGDASSAASTPDTSAAKLKYNLFDPTPNDLLRPFNADRPSKSDSPITVDAGRFQLEADFVNFTYDRYNALGANVRQETLLVAPTVLKAGLLPNADFELLVPTYVHVRTDDRDAHEVTKDDGYGDMTFRLKINLIGNDSGKLAFAFIPFIKAPTAGHNLGNGRVEGGISMPLTYSLPSGFSLFVEDRYDFLYNGDNDGYHVLFSNDIGLTRAVPGILDGKLSVYAEFASSVSSRSSDDDPLVLTADTGLIYQLTKNIAIDVDSFFGLTRGAADYNVFGGIAVRF